MVGDPAQHIGEAHLRIDGFAALAYETICDLVWRDEEDMLVAGVDGIRGGWIVVTRKNERLMASKARDFGEVLELGETMDMIGVDMPIGLSDIAEAGGRECDRLARKLLGRRHSSVFSPPARSTLRAQTYPEACSINRSASAANIGISQQAFGILSKLRNVDELMTPQIQERCIEVHPEVSFTALWDLETLSQSEFDPLQRKKSAKGRQQRLKLLALAGFEGLDELLLAGRALGAKTDDVLDGCIGAWTAGRAVQGKAQLLPSNPTRDSRGLRMQIWY